MAGRERATKDKKTFFAAALLLSLICFTLCAFCARAAAEALTSPFEDDAAQAIERARAGGIEAGENAGARILGGITPHHSLALDMIARFYERIAAENGRKISRVWLLSPDHFGRAKNYASVCDGDWRTAGRILEADAAAKSGFGGMGLVETGSRLFAEEHGITVHIPLIARYFPDAAVVPMVLRADIPDVPLLMLRNYMLGVMGPGDLIILSMDLSHYKTPEEMKKEDERTLPVLRDLQPMNTNRLDIDAGRAASLALRLFRDLGAERGVVMERMDTSDIMGARVESGTSYATIFYTDDRGGN